MKYNVYKTSIENIFVIFKFCLESE